MKMSSFDQHLQIHLATPLEQYEAKCLAQWQLNTIEGEANDFPSTIYPAASIDGFQSLRLQHICALDSYARNENDKRHLHS